jgi:hypothetical protein
MTQSHWQSPSRSGPTALPVALQPGPGLPGCHSATGTATGSDRAQPVAVRPARPARAGPGDSDSESATPSRPWAGPGSLPAYYSESESDSEPEYSTGSVLAAGLPCQCTSVTY